ncbi:MAG: leucine-rich repeat domain-containing protein, partial [Cyanobacteria bacterium P01_H01_bin.152]
MKMPLHPVQHRTPRIVLVGLVAILSAIAGCSVASTSPGSSTANAEAFTRLCNDRASLAPAAQHTMNVLLQIAATEDCDRAATTLSERTELDLADRAIEDLSPLSSFSQLTQLDLGVNQIVDITPLTSLPNLVVLDLSVNPIADLSSL